MIVLHIDELNDQYGIVRLGLHITVDEHGYVTHSNGCVGRAISGFIYSDETYDDPELGLLHKTFDLSHVPCSPPFPEPNVWFYYKRREPDVGQNIRLPESINPPARYTS